jgi:DNA-binding MarR family transcriptional regulator
VTGLNALRRVEQSNNGQFCRIEWQINLAAVSTRTAYECINKPAEMDLVEKARSARNGRSKYVRLLPDLMCEKICARCS